MTTDSKITLVICIIASALFNLFFLFTPWGISVLVYNVILLAIYYLYLRQRPLFDAKVFFPTAGIIIILSLPFFRYDYELFKAINIILLPLAYGFLVKNTFRINLLHILIKTISGTFDPFGKLPLFFKNIPISKGKQKKTIGKVLIGLLLSFVILIIVVPLLLSSDDVFKNIFEGWIDGINFGDVTIGEIILRPLIFLFIGAYLFAHFVATKYEEAEVAVKENSIFFDKIISVVVLISINIVYIMYSFIQVKYLFIKGAPLPEGITYAEYAREGFFQLLGVTLINLLIILIFNKFKAKSIVINILLLSTVICTYIMTYSAFFRMSLYESEFGYTRLRLLVYLFLIGEAIILVPMVIGIFKRQFKLITYVFLIGFIYYLMTTFVNIDGFVAEKNVDRFMTTKEIDYYHLSTQSLDALPDIDRLMAADEDHVPQWFIDDYNYYFTLDAKDPWYAYNIARSRADIK